MKRTRSMSALAPMLMSLALGCGGKAASSSTTPTGSGDVAAATAPDESQVGAGEEQDESTGDLAEHHRHHHHGGVAMFIAMSLEGLGTTPEQDQAISKIRDEMHAKMMPAHDAEKGVLLALADGIAAGQIDQGKVDAAVAQVSAAAAGVHDAVADSLNQLHATLTPEQRSALVQKVQAHFEVWNHVNSADEPADKGAHGGHLGELGALLTPDQVEKVHANLKASMAGGPHFDRSEADAHLKAFGEAFESDTFDAKTMTTGGAVNAHMAAWGVGRMVRVYEAVAPVLTPEQRAKVADMLRRHANYKRTENAT